MSTIDKNSGSVHAAKGGAERLPTLHAIPFHGDKIITFEDSGTHWVALRPTVETLGLSWVGQFEKVKRDPVLAPSVRVTRTVGLGGIEREITALDMRVFPLFLAKISAGRVSDKVREKLIRYQTESAAALYDYWFKGSAIRGDMDGIVTDLDPKVMSALGGMFKRILQKQTADLEERVNALVEQRMADQRGAYIPGWTAGNVVREAMGDEKGIKGLSQMVSRCLWRFHAQEGVKVKYVEIGLSSVYLYDPATCRKWLAMGGKAAILRYVEKKRGVKDRGLFRLVPTEGA